MLCMVVYRPYSDPHSRVRVSDRASHIPRVRDYRRGYAMATLHAYSSDPRALLVLADFVFGDLIYDLGSSHHVDWVLYCSSERLFGALSNVDPI